MPTWEELDKMTEEQEKQLNKALLAMYAQALKDTRNQLVIVYEKYSNENIVDYATMQKYDRLSALEKSIMEQLTTLYADAGKALTSILSEIYSSNYLYTGFILESGLQVGLNYALLSPEVIKKAIQNPISGLTLNQRLGKNRTELIMKTREQLTQGLIQGESIQKMGKRIKDLYEGDATKSLRIAQTETNRVRNAGKEIGYDKAKAKGIDFTKVWIASLDSHTRDTHRKLDGAKANKDGYFVIGGKKALHPGGFGVAELDINCRCTTRAEFKGFEPTARRAKGEGIIDYATYEEWEKERVSK
jgi:SPP1 gp7 family putative phage head morphogenesis protein